MERNGSPSHDLILSDIIRLVNRRDGTQPETTNGRLFPTYRRSSDDARTLNKYCAEPMNEHVDDWIRLAWPDQLRSMRAAVASQIAVAPETPEPREAARLTRPMRWLLERCAGERDQPGRSACRNGSASV